ncbi:MAG: hypothetical protein QOI86_3024 [Actinomycetota bacterium]|nr:hypothetical protein [Actinomycetota bacterium]
MTIGYDPNGDVPVPLGDAPAGQGTKPAPSIQTTPPPPMPSRPTVHHHWGIRGFSIQVPGGVLLPDKAPGSVDRRGRAVKDVPSNAPQRP